MATVQIKEGDQLILSCDLREIASQNEFIRSLVADAQSSSDGLAEREDNEGCLVTALIFEDDQAVAEHKTITVTWHEGKLVARCEDDHTLSSSVVDWPEPIDANTDSWAVAHAVTEINGAEIISVEHDGEYVHVIVSGEVCV